MIGLKLLNRRRVITGILNERLLPIIPASFRNLDGDWQEFNVLLDTGSENSLLVPEAMVRQHQIALKPIRSSPAHIDPLQLPRESIRTYPFWVDLLLEGNQRVVAPEIIIADSFAGVIGPSLLLNRRITIDVVSEGAVTIDCIPAPTRLARMRNLFWKQDQQLSSVDYLWRLPWVDVSVKDIQGRTRCFSANVDTGSSGDLSLPPSKVEEFGLVLPDKCLVMTPNGEIEASCGEVEMIWQGRCRTVQCTQHEDYKPPLIGMGLLYGNLITIDLDCPAPAVQIEPISWTASLLQSLARRLRLSSATEQEM